MKTKKNRAWNLLPFGVAADAQWKLGSKYFQPYQNIFDDRK